MFYLAVKFIALCHHVCTNFISMWRIWYCRSYWGE